MVNRNKSCIVSRSISGESFILLKPSTNGNSDAFARRLAMCRGVREVRLTSGEYGFVVAARQDSEKRIRKLAKRSMVKIAVNHYVYRSKNR